MLAMIVPMTRGCAGGVVPLFTRIAEGIHPQTHLKDLPARCKADAFAGITPFTGQVVFSQPVVGRTRAASSTTYMSTDLRDHHACARQNRRTYRIERDIRGSPPDERCLVRQARAAPVVIALRAWLTEKLPTLSRKSVTAETIGYALNQWQALTRYLVDGEVEIDNSAAERSLRGIALGRKNYLFMGSERGGERAATMYSLMETVKLNGINPEAYLRHVLSVIAEYPVNRIADLLPWNVKI